MTYSNSTAWRSRHAIACLDPRAGAEAGLVLFMRGIGELVDDHRFPDAVASPAFGDLMRGFRTLLNFDLGRLDAGTLDDWACQVAEKVRWDLDTEAITWG